MNNPNSKAPNFGVNEYWYDALDAPAATQMKYLKQLMLNHSFLDRVPDQTLIAGENGEKYDYVIATRGNDYAMAYTYNGRHFDINMGKITGDEVKASWFNPRDGQSTAIDTYPNEGTVTFDPPGEKEDGNDWVLVLESV